MKNEPPRKRQDQDAQEVAEQSARSKQALERVERVLGGAIAIIEEYNSAEAERLRMRQR